MIARLPETEQKPLDSWMTIKEDISVPHVGGRKRSHVFEPFTDSYLHSALDSPPPTDLIVTVCLGKAV